MNTDQLVLIHSVFEQDGKQEQRIGTGYFIRPDLVLTANHVCPVKDCISIRVRVEKTEEWINATSKLHWQNISLDAALIHVNRNTKIKDQWLETPLEKDNVWNSAGYPIAAATVDNEGVNFTTLGLSGDVYFAGGRGQSTIRQLDLTVKAPPSNLQDWKGISGAPVLVDEKLIGIIKTVQKEFKERIQGVPFFELLKDADFRAAIDKKKQEIPEHDNWALILLSENSREEDLLQPSKAAINKCLEENCIIIVENIINILANPDSLLDFIKLVCKAPVMIIDATEFQPGIMFMIGIRSVVRKSVTIVVTIKPLQESELSGLPFNIQQIKIFALHFESYMQTSNLPSKDRLIVAINEGLSQAEKNPDYLDLPAYNAVRNLVVYDMPALKEKVLVLCPFNENYRKRFLFLRDKLANSVENESIVRMLDINSPQLVSQSLYEHIRWTRGCIIDWTGWLPNVFYELGVRLASSDIPPVILIDQDADEAKPKRKKSPLTLQQKMLMQLFHLYPYSLKDEAFPSKVQQHLDFVNGKISSFYVNQTPDKVYYENIFSTAQEYYDWRQEKTNILPYESIKEKIERSFGRDWQKVGRLNILYSKNEGFNDAVQKQTYEYWLSAWYYLINRNIPDAIKEYNIEEIKLDPKKMQETVSLGNSVVAALNKPAFRSISQKIFKLISELKKLLPDE